MTVERNEFGSLLVAPFLTVSPHPPPLLFTGNWIIFADATVYIFHLEIQHEKLLIKRYKLELSLLSLIGNGSKLFSIVLYFIPLFLLG